MRVHDDGDNSPGAYSLAFDRLSPAPPTTPVLTLGTEIRAAIDAAGDVDHYVFEGTEGERMQIEATDNTTSVFLCVTVFDPNGVISQPEVCNPTAVGIGVSITQTGTWSVLVRESDDDDGDV